MGMVTIKLRPGVNVEQTPTLLEAGWSIFNLARFRAGLAEKIGGWVKYYAAILDGVPKCLHAWQDLNETDRLAVGTTELLGYVEGSAFVDLTPQTLESDFQPNFATTSGSSLVTITDANIANVTTDDSIEFSTPVAVGGVILSGVYPINSVLSSTSYRIDAVTLATSTQANATITAITQANPGSVTTSAAHGFSTGDLIYIYGVVGMTQVNGVLFSITNTGATTFTLGVDTSAYTIYGSAGTASPASVPKFATGSASASVTVTLADHGLVAGDTINFPLSTTVGGVTISGTYVVNSNPAVATDTFSITASNQASSTATAMMNAGLVELDYYISIGPLPAATGYSVGGYSTGGYSTGSVPSSQTGTPITATDWTLDNWGQVMLACPDGGAIYIWQPNTGFATAQPLAANDAPVRNTGMFVSMQTQMVIAYGSTDPQSIGLDTDPLLVKWCAQGDYTDWTPSQTSQAGSRRIPTGSKLVSGLSVSQQELLWTDLDLWSMTYLGFPEAWGFTRIGNNCGLIGKRAVARQGANVYWMGPANFFVLGGGGVNIIPCTVWDAVYQDLNTDYQEKCWAWSNTPFNEVWFFYPRASTSATEPDAYVKFNTAENVWDYGADDIIDRSCGIDQSILGKPIAASPTGLIYQHEEGYNADGVPIQPVIETGWFALTEGHDIMFVDWIIFDMIFKLFNSSNQSAQIQMTIYSAMYPNDTPRTYGPYTFTNATLYQNLRVRGRLVKLKFTSSDTDSYWRIGGPRARLAASGTR